jgi:hypothetical protein
MNIRRIVYALAQIVPLRHSYRRQVHTCQPIGLDKVLLVRNGLPPKLMVINKKTGAVEIEHALPSGANSGLRPGFEGMARKPLGDAHMVIPDEAREGSRGASARLPCTCMGLRHALLALVAAACASVLLSPPVR